MLAFCIFLLTGHIAWVSADVSKKPIDWESVAQETKQYLADLIRIDTVSPPGNETKACQYIADVLKKEKIPYEILESTPGRGNILARLKGNGSKKPILLLAHLDVVGVEKEKWTEDPFGGAEKDGYIYGRGAVDDKAWVAAGLSVLILLKRQSVPLSRDVIFLGEADEESGGKFGIKWLIQNHFEKLDAEYALNEGGDSQIRDGKIQVLGIQSTEKLYHDIRLVARGPSGHASAPVPDNAIFALVRALHRIESYEPEIRLNPVTQGYLQGVARFEGREFQQAVSDLVSGDSRRVKRGAGFIKRYPYFYSMLHDSISPTILGGGIRANVIPAEAWGNLNVRLLPDSITDRFVEALKKVAAEPQVEIVATTKPLLPPPPVMPLDSELFKAFVEVGRELSPEAVVVPSMSTGATDSEHLRRKGISAYGFAFPLLPEDKMRMHGHDERIPITSLSFGLRFIYQSVLRVSQ